jgi:hypothetical protein
VNNKAKLQQSMDTLGFDKTEAFNFALRHAPKIIASAQIEREPLNVAGRCVLTSVLLFHIFSEDIINIHDICRKVLGPQAKMAMMIFNNL